MTKMAQKVVEPLAGLLPSIMLSMAIPNLLLHGLDRDKRQLMVIQLSSLHGYCLSRPYILKIGNQL